MPTSADPDGATLEALRGLSTRYAIGVDRRDGELYAGVFAPGGSLIIEPGPNAPVEPRTVTGEDRLAAIATAMSRFPATFHFVGQSRYSLADDTATGEVYCIAHHLRTDGSSTADDVMFIRYLDEYERMAGTWFITTRRVHVDWLETRDTGARPKRPTR
jgi:hypothetical protein